MIYLKMVLCCIIFFGIALPTHGISKEPLDILDPNYYSYENTAGSVSQYLGRIERILKKGVGKIDNHAKDISKELSAIKTQQESYRILSTKNEYEIRLVKFEQKVIVKRLTLLEEQGEQSRKFLELLSKGVEKSLRFVNGVYGVIGLLVGILGTVAGGLIIILIKNKLKVARKESTTKEVVNEE